MLSLNSPTAKCSYNATATVHIYVLNSLNIIK
jgi:hypothetical protein